ncbi:MAG: hypothetical protein HY720_08420, partial [Planctomycetes bacterium]|nr:hypothetical protein [Planctomycetota bacterium]
MVLDKNPDHRPGSEQMRWLAAELAGGAWRSARFRLAAFHHPAFAVLWHEPGYDGSHDRPPFGRRGACRGKPFGQRGALSADLVVARARRSRAPLGALAPR